MVTHIGRLLNLVRRDNVNRYITLDADNKVISIRFGQFIVEGEIQSDSGELGQIMQADGTFATPPVDPVIPQKTLEEQIAELKQDNLILMDVLATMYEDMLAKGTV